MDEPRAAPASNVPEYSVSEISGAVKRTLEGTFNRVRVRGEVTECKRYPSGHIYFSLKDESAKISGIVWKGTVSRLGLQPENGVEVIATGRISSYPERSSYQLIVERMEYAGAGALLARIEMLRQKLTTEGLFDASRKRVLPTLPRVIGVVSSERGAVIQDIRATIARRFPRTILLWPVPVQGEGSAERIAAAIEGFNAMDPNGLVPRPDVIIVARGGGSLEDLMAFNEEIVVRAAAASQIPLISAVGHETDVTLIDFASDRRAPTPTAAAEMAIPARAELVADLSQKASRLIGSLNQLLQRQRLRLSLAERKLPDLPALLGTARQRLDDRAERLGLSLTGLLERRRSALIAVERRLPDLPAVLSGLRERVRERGVRLVIALPNLVAMRGAALNLTGQKLLSALRQSIGRVQANAGRVLGRPLDTPVCAGLREARTRLQGAAGRLESVSPLAVLQRGYALVTDTDGHPLTSAASVKPGARLKLRFADAEIRATADGGRPPSRQGVLPI